MRRRLVLPRNRAIRVIFLRSRGSRERRRPNISLFEAMAGRVLGIRGMFRGTIPNHAAGEDLANLRSNDRRQRGRDAVTRA